jgi:hypothetical protein
MVRVIVGEDDGEESESSSGDDEKPVIRTERRCPKVYPPR